MKILILSDTHGALDILPYALRMVGGRDKINLVLHAGDVCGDEDRLRGQFECPVFMVSGNNDWGSDLPKEIVHKVGKHTLYMTHGHAYGVYYGLDKLNYAAQAHGADIAIFGHTHVPCLDTEGSVWLLNPGSLSEPRRGSFSFMLVDVDADGEWHPELKTVGIY